MLIVLLCACAIVIAFANSGNNPLYDSGTIVSKEIKLEKFLTGYNPDFEKKGIVKSSFKHELNPLYKK